MQTVATECTKRNTEEWLSIDDRKEKRKILL